jgi:type VI secretion system protein ImpK
MSADDPFFGGDKSEHTILRPRPGGRRPAAPAASPPPSYAPPPSYGSEPSRSPAQGYPPAAGYAPAPSYAPRAADPREPLPQQPLAAMGRLAGGLNPITAAATTLLALLAQLRESAHHPDPDSLFQHIGNELRQFEAAARAQGESDDMVLAARYVLCAALDETVLNTPWGSQSRWASETLLMVFHNDAWGGEKVFQWLERLVREPGRNLHLLELIYLCIALGFAGKYRIQDRGRAELERIHEGLHQTIRQQRGDFERTLSPRWQGVQDKRLRLAQYVPLWVVAAVGAGVLAAVYMGFLVAASRAAEPVLTQVAALGRSDVPRAAPVAAPARPSVDLRPFLQTQIADRSLAVEDVAQGQVVTMAGDGLFSSGRADVRPERVPLLLAIADALNEVPGRVLITGHSDNVPMSVLGRYKSNWDLSQARAEAVLQILGTRVTGDRLVADGVADTQPVDSNDTAEGRSRNRRVEITLTAQAGRQ